ncbi:tripartite motif-containing protein 2-like isoform X1 [Ptychodera flava]|uniref:tripartite motif-containing protein 2-like isoform X1 n=1 Tax=Ptychodera flava TaxID=63121 RepID=UPI003969DDA2
MASADSDDDDHKSLKEEMLTCQLCFEVYKTPKLLSCQHSFCEHCLERWVQTNHGILVCPCCRQHVSLPVGGVKGLPTNRVISHFFDYIDRSKRKAAESQGVPCETCSSNNTADNRCIECFQYLCGRCSIVHGKVRKTRKHRLMPVGEFEKERLTNPTIEQPETYCEKHSDIAIDVFCKTCEICVCLKCALTEHPNPTHQYVSVDEVAIKAKKDFREFVQQLHQDRIRTADARNAVENELLQLEKNLKTGMEKIDNHADKIIQNVREMQKKTKATYKKAFDIKNEVLKSQIQNLERREKSLSNTREFAEMQINYASSAQFLVWKDEMKQQVQNILSTKVNTNLEESSCLDFKVDASPAVDEFGQVQTSSAVGHMSELSGLFAENLTVGEEHTLNIWKKDSKGFDDAAGPYEEANAEDNVSGAVHSRVLQVENSTVNASLCDGTVEIPSEGNYQLKASVCGQQTSRTPKFMRLCAAGSSTVSNWVPRRDENNPKTIEQIHKETKLTQEQQLLFLQQQCLPQSNKRVRGRGDRGQGQADDGWSMVSSTRSRPCFDPNKFKLVKKTVYENIQLGPGSRPGGVFGGWGRSSSGGTGSKSQQEQQEAIHTPTNRFLALASEETQVYDISRRGSRELGRGRDNKGSRQLSGLRRSSSRESARDGRNREREEAIAIPKNLSSSQALAERGKDRARKLELGVQLMCRQNPKMLAMKCPRMPWRRNARRY